MITYDPLYKTMQEKGISIYKLIKEHNKPISTVTLNDLCRILHCRVEDIVLYIPDER